VRYPDPFFDLAHTYLPTSILALFRWCRYYYLTSPLIAAAVDKLAEYPITALEFTGSSTEVHRLWEAYFEDDLHLRETLVDIGVFYNCYGNTIGSLHFPATKWLVCENCHHEEPATAAKYDYRGCKFHLKCAQCGHNGPAEVRERAVKTTKGARLLLWNPEDMEVRYNEFTGHSTYYYRIPAYLRTAVRLGRRDIVDHSPQVFLDAVREEKAVVLNPENVVHLRRPSIMTGQLNRGLGIPLVLPVLKNNFYLQIMRKAQEAVLAERLVPLNILFPTQSAPGVNPYELMDLSRWRDQVNEEVNHWRRDPNYIPVLPLPVGHQMIGGDGRALLLYNEMRSEAETILVGMGIPPELVFGGLSWSASNVSLRMLENRFLRYIAGLEQLLNSFVIPRTAAHMGWPAVRARFRPFKMADDLQRSAFLFQLNQAKLVSDTTMRRETNLDPDTEDERLKKEVKSRLHGVEEQQMAEARISGQVGVLTAKYQAKAQQVMAEEQRQMQSGTYGAAPGEEGAGMGQEAVAPVAAPAGPVPQILQRLQGLSPEAQQQVLQRIGQQNPELASSLAQQLQPASTPASDSAGAPLPEQLPPRRQAQLI